MAIAVEEEAVEGNTQMGLQMATQAQEGLPPREGSFQQTAVPVVATGIPDPAGESGHGMAAAIDPHHGLAPGEALLQVLQEIGEGQSARVNARPLGEALKPARPMI
jgi:hypothetical protein